MWMKVNWYWTSDKDVQIKSKWTDHFLLLCIVVRKVQSIFSAVWRYTASCKSMKKFDRFTGGNSTQPDGFWVRRVSGSFGWEVFSGWIGMGIIKEKKNIFTPILLSFVEGNFGYKVESDRVYPIFFIY